MDIKEILKQVTVDCKDNGHHFTITDRLRVIEKILNGSKYQLLHSGNLCRIYGKQPVKGKSVILISSHVDCVYNRLFCEETTDGQYLRGTFDNSITNACVLSAMLKGSLSDNVVVAFTGDEEEESGGAYEVVEKLRECDSHIALAIVLDVTEEGWEERNLFTIENDLGIDILTGHRIISTLEKYQGEYGFVHDSEPDESYDYDEKNIPCFSLCIPSLGDMHSERGVLVRRESLPIYCDVLSELTNALVTFPQTMGRVYYIEYEELGNHIRLYRIHTDEDSCNDNYESIQVKEKNGTLVLPSMINGLPVTEIEDFYMMRDREAITARVLVVPASFRRLGKKNFSGWKYLEKVVLNCQESAMCEWNFAYCDNLRTVVCRNSSVYNYCKRLPLDHSDRTYGCFDRCLDNIEFIFDK